jgi:hypothetical protein
MEKRKRKKPVMYSAEDLIEGWHLALKRLKKNKELGSLPVFSNSEMDMMTWLLFWKEEEFRVWVIKKEDKRAIKQFIREREATKQGVSLEASTIYLRRMNFITELLKCNFNSAEAARRCGYSRKYAKQAGYRIRRDFRK